MIKNNTAFYILRLLETSGLGVVKTNSIIESVGHNFEPNRLQSILNKKQFENFLSNEEKVLSNWEQIEENGINCITILDEDYPELLKNRLQKKAPPLLMVLGNKKLLNKATAGFCGSRKASEKGIATAKDCADQLARKGINIVSGYAAGVDMATHKAALECGGTTTLVLCEGILHFRKKRELKDIWDWERIAVVSEFLPGVPWSARNAMQRNNTICALTSTMILIESASKGGSIAAGRTSIKMGIPLFAPVYKGMPETAIGNRELLGQGAQELYKNSHSNRANMKKVFAAIEQQEAKSVHHTHASRYDINSDTNAQLSLFEDKGSYGE
ncbi:MAG: DNA-processing protein DprA [Deltaproteobacteria bacterium]|nr:DNA-processing protein DprA [Deltaproteobacteria bacterium]MBW1965162.1 DNA-processing protein DprA [Deltaproteobacteria bacterium]